MTPDFKARIKENNATHVVDSDELAALMKRAQEVYHNHFDMKTWFERSVFINWTCGIADCKYCYLSTKPKLQKNALRSPESILAEMIICKAMGWDVGYITGGLRVESTEYLVELIKKINAVLGEKTMMNFGPYSPAAIEKFAPHISGMGVAIESFDEELHNFICPSKPLSALMRTLDTLKQKELKKIITIILGIGEKKSDVEHVIEYIKKYDIDKLQLCFLKPQENTVFDTTPAPDPQYMAWWIAKVRIACPKTIIKVALVRERIEDTSLYLDAGANCFSRFMVFNDFGSEHARAFEDECKKAGRELQGEFVTLPDIDVAALMKELELDDALKERILPKAQQYYDKLKKCQKKHS